MEGLLWRHQFTGKKGGMKTLSIRQGDMCLAKENYDVVVCSAFKGDYVPTQSSLVGALYRTKGISLYELAKNPRLDLRMMGCWLSRELEGNFKRIACVELLDHRSWLDMACKNEIMLKSAFSTLRFMLEQAAIQEIPVRSVALPVLGTGNQGIEICYIVGPLLNQCLQALDNIEELEEITFFERSPEKAWEIAEALRKTLTKQPGVKPQVFISYRSTDQAYAYSMREALTAEGFSCWMAPESIPSGSDYLEEIATALRQVTVVTLLLTPQAELSPWVSKEIGTAVGNGCTVLPFQMQEYPLSAKFQFLLDGIQIIPAWKYPQEERLKYLSQEVRKYVF